jgi:hypothetical protein
MNIFQQCAVRLARICLTYHIAVPDWNRPKAKVSKSDYGQLRLCSEVAFSMFRLTEISKLLLPKGLGSGKFAP